MIYLAILGYLALGALVSYLSNVKFCRSINNLRDYLNSLIEADDCEVGPSLFLAYILLAPIFAYILTLI